MELEISRRIALDGTINRAKGFDSILLQFAVMYYDYNVLRHPIFCL